MRLHLREADEPSSSALGRTDILEVLLWMRSKENPPVISPQLPRYGGRDFVSWAKNPEFRNEVDEYRSRAREIISSAGVPAAEIQLLENRFFGDQLSGKKRKSRRFLRRLDSSSLTLY